VTNPRYLLLDEPFTGIDPIAIGDIKEIVARLKERGIGVLITDHNVRETLAITDRAYILRRSHSASGTATELANNPRPERSTQREVLLKLVQRMSQRVVMTPLL
jgi:lipopolysaccharide export system ATP-binding protein